MLSFVDLCFDLDDLKQHIPNYYKIQLGGNSLTLTLSAANLANMVYENQ